MSGKSTKAEKVVSIKGARLKECRRAKGLTLKALAARAGFNGYGAQYVSKLENESGRELSEANARKLGRALGVRAEYLLGNDSYKTEEEWNNRFLEQDQSGFTAAKEYFKTLGISIELRPYWKCYDDVIRKNTDYRCIVPCLSEHGKVVEEYIRRRKAAIKRGFRGKDGKYISLEEYLAGDYEGADNIFMDYNRRYDMVFGDFVDGVYVELDRLPEQVKELANFQGNKNLHTDINWGDTATSMLAMDQKDVDFEEVVQLEFEMRYSVTIDGAFLGSIAADQIGAFFRVVDSTVKAAAGALLRESIKERAFQTSKDSVESLDCDRFYCYELV